jgi:hypothetical protein
MAVTYDELLNHVGLMIGESPDGRIKPYRIINDAGQYLMAMHTWHWRHRPPVGLSFVQDQQHVDLPVDFGFGDIISLSTTDNVTYGVTLSTIGDVEFKRSTTILSPSFYFVAISYPTQSDTTSGGQMARLEVYPTPTADDTDALKMNYRAGWTLMGPKNDAAANIPPLFDHLLVQLVRAFAYYYETNDRSMIESIEDSIQLQRLKGSDNNTQGNLGLMQGGILQVDRTIRSNWNFTTVNPT